MNRALLPSLFLALTALSCSDEPTMRPGIFSTDATVTLTDLGVSDVPAMDVLSGDRGPVTTDTAVAMDTGPTTDVSSDTDAGTTTTDAGTSTTDAGTTTTDTGTSTTDAGTTTTDTGSTTDAGTATDAGSTTDAGPCAAELTACSNGDGGAPICTNTRVDTLNCGACGVRCCQATDTCAAGVCTSRCPTLQASCLAPPTDAGCVATRCVDVSVDDLNCGACGRACPEGKGCVSGRCI